MTTDLETNMVSVERIKEYVETPSEVPRYRNHIKFLNLTKFLNYTFAIKFILIACYFFSISQKEFSSFCSKAKKKSWRFYTGCNSEVSVQHIISPRFENKYNKIFEMTLFCDIYNNYQIETNGLTVNIAFYFTNTF